MRITSDRLNDNTVDDSTTSGLVPATDFDTNTFQGYKVNGLTTISVVVTYTGLSNITANSSGNITNTACATLPDGWRPPTNLIASLDKGSVATGSLSIAPNGTCTLYTLSPTAAIEDGDNITFMATWVSGNE